MQLCIFSQCVQRLHIGGKIYTTENQQMRAWFAVSLSAKSAVLVTQMVKNLPAMRETQVQSLGWEDPLEKGMATHSNILAWRIPWTEEPGRLYSPWGGKESDTTEWLAIHLKLIYSVSNKILKEIK